MNIHLIRARALAALGVAILGLTLQSCDSSKATAPAPIILTSVSAGAWHACGLTSTGAAYCWGNNTFGGLGDSTTIDYRPRMTAVHGGFAFSQISSGFTVFTSASDEATCAVKTAGGVMCWGENSTAALGDGTQTSRSFPTATSNSANFTKVFAGYSHSCGLTAAGAASCWGRNAWSQLGDASTTTRLAPVAVAGGLAFQTLAVGYEYTCGVTTGGAAYCWGYNGVGYLGDGTFTDRTAPTAVTGGLTFKDISAGEYMTCGLTTAGAAYCWGRDSLSSSHKNPRAIAGGHVFESITVGSAHACALTSAGAAWCWGSNTYGQFGDGSTTTSVTPVAVFGSNVFTHVSAGRFFTCGTTTSTTYCWGSNYEGNIGDGTTTDRLVPTAVLTP